MRVGDLSGMTKSDLIERVAIKVPHVSKKDTETVVNTIFDCMTEALRKGDRIEIRGFGSFQVKVREAREGRNPKTGEEVKIPAKRTPFFKVGKELKERIEAKRRQEAGGHAPPTPRPSAGSGGRS
jgi:integration host factor subunit beta